MSRDGRGGIIGNTNRMVGGERGTGMGLEGGGGEKECIKLDTRSVKVH